MPNDQLTQWIEPAQRERLQEALTASVKQPIWWEIAGEKPKGLDFSKACKTCRFVRRSPGNRRSCQRSFLGALEKARQGRKPRQFLCPIERHAVVLPLIKDGKAKGYLGMCHSEEAVSKTDLELAGLTVETALREHEKDQELKNLSETVQPRCVALSTVHTVHRLISSTLNLEELLPRMARLCCQVLRAQSCGIWLLDRETQRLVPRASVDLSRSKASRLQATRVGSGMIGKVAAQCTAKLTGRVMVVPLFEEECIGVILVRRQAGSKPFAPLDQEILTTLAEQAVVAIHNAQMYETQERITWGTIQSLSGILGGMDTYASGAATNLKILSGVALAIGRQMELGSTQLRSLEYAALLHDAGRVGIPAEILKKTSKLDPQEFAKIKEHHVKGTSVLQPLDILEPAIPIILYHHERFDGTGYPKGLKKEEIPLGARILAIANAFEAMISERPYRQKTLTVRKAVQEITTHAGTQFDPGVVKAFIQAARSKRLEPFLPSLSRKRARNGRRAE